MIPADQVNGPKNSTNFPWADIVRDLVGLDLHKGFSSNPVNYEELAIPIWLDVKLFRCDETEKKKGNF